MGLANLYGPTEASIDVTCHVIEKRPADQDRIPIGVPVDNAPILILDENLRPVPKGELGSFALAESRVAQGYLFEPELTAKAFVDNPFPEMTGEKIYKTGDLACERPDGSFDYHGRKDSQVKIRGFRVELGEIENVLCAHAGVEESAVLAIDEDDGTKAPRGLGFRKDRGGRENIERPRGQPVPPRTTHVIFHQDTLPKNPNGKLDRKALLGFYSHPPIVVSIPLTDKSANGKPPERQSLLKKEANASASPAQRWIFSYFDPPYKWGGYSRFRFNGRLDQETITEAFQKLIARHPALRTIFVNEDGEWRAIRN